VAIHSMRRVGSCNVREAIGRAARAVVYRGDDAVLGRPAALEVFSGSARSAGLLSLELMRPVALLAGRLGDHPDFVRILRLLRNIAGDERKACEERMAACDEIRLSSSASGVWRRIDFGPWINALEGKVRDDAVGAIRKSLAEAEGAFPKDMGVSLSGIDSAEGFGRCSGDPSAVSREIAETAKRPAFRTFAQGAFRQAAPLAEKSSTLDPLAGRFQNPAMHKDGAAERTAYDEKLAEYRTIRKETDSVTNEYKLASSDWVDRAIRRSNERAGGPGPPPAPVTDLPPYPVISLAGVPPGCCRILFLIRPPGGASVSAVEYKTDSGKEEWKNAEALQRLAGGIYVAPMEVRNLLPEYLPKEREVRLMPSRKTVRFSRSAQPEGTIALVGEDLFSHSFEVGFDGGAGENLVGGGPSPEVRRHRDLYVRLGHAAGIMKVRRGEPLQLQVLDWREEQ
jgi:hypothetical protein